MAPFGLCIVGCGRFATFHAHAARRLGGVTLSFASRERARAESYRRRFGGTEAFEGYEAAAADPRVEALLFCTPHGQHLENVRLAIKHHKAALLEKPIGRTVEEADQILDETARAGIPFMVAENFHFMPAQVAARALLRSGVIGSVRQILVSARGYRPPADWRRARDAMGGGVLIDGGIHYLHLLRDWGGEVEAVSAMAPPNLFPELEGEDTVFVLVSFRTGAVGALANSLAAPGLRRWQASLATGTEGSLLVDNGGRWLQLRRGRSRRFRLFLRDRRGLAAQLRDFRAAVREGQPPTLTARATREDLVVVMAAYRALATGGVVRVPAPSVEA